MYIDNCIYGGTPFVQYTHPVQKWNGVPGTWPAHDQHMMAHDDDDDNVDDVDNVDNVDNGDNHPHKYILK